MYHSLQFYILQNGSFRFSFFLRRANLYFGNINMKAGYGPYAFSNREVTLAGFEALNAMSLEKGHRHWHADIETTDRPQEAGLMFACRKNADFEGKCAMKTTQPLKRLATFTVAPEVPLNGTEPIYR